MTNEQAPAHNERDIIKPMDKHAPIATPGLGKKAPVKPVNAEASPSGTVTAQDKHAPLGEPR
ncbi:hypothetical protein ACO0M4_21670 [Streptomyces sp. RGM 3693]|uniref:hypothetical protein n=1 Tax=Streptomyces sp. RGM 3693 TaxID=3413284 RepID=UPI003D2A9FA0